MENTPQKVQLSRIREVPDSGEYNYDERSDTYTFSSEDSGMNVHVDNGKAYFVIDESEGK
jgi:hypothetical protein